MESVRIGVHLYGILRSLVPGSHADEDTMLWLNHVPEETFGELVARLGLSSSDLGDCFINGSLAKLSDPIPEGARIGLFPFNMVLLCGGQHLKGHGYTHTDLDVDYY